MREGWGKKEGKRRTGNICEYDNFTIFTISNTTAII